MCQFMNLQPHPALKQHKPMRSNVLIPENSIESIPTQQQQEPVSTTQYLVIQNTQLDLITLKLMNFLWPFCANLQVLKLFNLKPTREEVMELISLVQRNKVGKFFAEFLQADADLVELLCEHMYDSSLTLIDRNRPTSSRCT